MFKATFLHVRRYNFLGERLDILSGKIGPVLFEISSPAYPQVLPKFLAHLSPHQHLHAGGLRAVYQKVMPLKGFNPQCFVPN